MNFRAGKQIFAALLLITVSSPLYAEGGTDNQRYSIVETPNGLVRLDRKSGRISVCKMSNAQLVCKLAADERQAYQEEIDRIDDKLSTLEKRVADIESGKFLKRKAKKSMAETEAEFDQAMKFADKAFRHFFNLMQDVKKKPKKDAI